MRRTSLLPLSIAVTTTFVVAASCGDGNPTTSTSSSGNGGTSVVIVTPCCPMGGEWCECSNNPSGVELDGGGFKYFSGCCEDPMAKRFDPRDCAITASIGYDGGCNPPPKLIGSPCCDDGVVVCTCTTADASVIVACCDDLNLSEFEAEQCKPDYYGPDGSCPYDPPEDGG